MRFIAKKPPETPIDDIDAVPPILSLLCRELNERRFAAPYGTVDRPAEQMTFRERDADIETIIAAFYERCVVGRPESVRIFIEEELVSYSGARLAQDEQSILRVFERGCDIPGTAGGRRAPGFGEPLQALACLQELVNERLLSALADKRYELIHDLLASVVEKSRTARAERLESQEAARRAEQERQAKRTAEEQARRAHRQFLSATAALVIAIIAAVIGFAQVPHR